MPFRVLPRLVMASKLTLLLLQGQRATETKDFIPRLHFLDLSGPRCNSTGLPRGPTLFIAMP